MKNVKTIYSLKELHDVLESHTDLKRLILFLDLDLTLIRANEDDKDELIEPEVTKKMFDFLHENNIWYVFLTARFHNIICLDRKRKESLPEMKENIENLYPIFEQLGVDCSHFKDSKNEYLELIKNEKNKTVGIMYKGILLGDKKGEIIKHFRLKYGLDKTHPHTMFADDLDRYIRNVKKHVPNSFVFRRLISDDYSA